MNARLAHLLDIESLSAEQACALLARAGALRSGDEDAFGKCAGTLLVNLFYEPSTRTRVSFEIAARRLGMQVVNVAASGSSVAKGESLRDTYATLQAMQPDVIVLRHPDNGVHHTLLDITQPGVHLINAGDGSRSHPSQALLDAFTIQSHYRDLSTITVLVAGDLHHSRVTRSGVALLKKLGVGEIRLASPPGLEAGPNVAAGTRAFDNLDEALEGVDVVMMLRVQRERLAGQQVPDRDDYHAAWGLTAGRLARAAPGAIVMHPGPMNRGAEIASEVADGPRSVILEQVRNGVWLRMALLLTLLGVPQSP